MRECPLVSVVIPVYNVEKYLARCLDSVLAQDYKNTDIICVNDCSTDGSEAILRYYESEYENIRVLQPDCNGGLGAARDFGLRCAVGDYICFIDSDDYIEKNYISAYMKVMEPETDIVVGGYWKAIKDKRIENKVVTSDTYAWVMPSVWIRMFRTEFLKSNGIDFRGLRYYEDGVFNLRCMVAKPVYKIIDYCGYHYFIHSTSITQGRRGEMLFEAYVTNYRKLAAEINWKQIDASTRETLEYEYVQGTSLSMIYNLRHAGCDLVKSFSEMRASLLQEYFPDYKRNRLLKIGQLKGDSKKNRMILWIYLLIEKMHLESLFLNFIAR